MLSLGHTGNKMHSPDPHRPEIPTGNRHHTTHLTVRNLITRFNHIKLPLLLVKKANTGAILCFDLILLWKIPVGDLI